MPEKSSEFISGTEKAALFLEAALRKDGYDTSKSSELITRRLVNLGGKYVYHHVHRVYVKCGIEILNNYVEWISDKFPDTFMKAGYTTRECPNLPERLPVSIFS